MTTWPQSSSQERFGPCETAWLSTALIRLRSMPSSAKVGLDCCRHQSAGQPAAPPLWRSEWRNVLTTYLRRDLLQLSQAVALMQRAEVLLAGQDEPVASEQVLQLAHSSRCRAYDCEFVAAAQQLGVPLVTEDRAVLVAFPDVARPLV